MMTGKDEGPGAVSMVNLPAFDETSGPEEYTRRMMGNVQEAVERDLAACRAHFGRVHDDEVQHLLESELRLVGMVNEIRAARGDQVHEDVQLRRTDVGVFATPAALGGPAETPEEVIARGTGSVARESRIGELELTVRRLELGTGIRGAAIGMTHVDMLGAHDAALGDVDGRVSRLATRTATLDTELRERVETLERLYGDLNEGLTLRVDRLNEWLERLAKDEGERLNELEKRVPFDEGGGLLERIGRIDDHLQSLDEGLGAADRARSSHRDGLESRLQALEERGVSWDGSAEQIELLVAGQMARCDAEGCRRWTLRPETEGWARIVNDGEAWLCPDHRTDGGSS